MKKVLSAFLVLGSFAVPLSAYHQDDTNAVIDRAMKAMGGQDKLSKYKAARWKGKGRFYAIPSEPVDYTFERSYYVPGQARIDVVANGGSFKMTRIINRDQGWIDTGGNVVEMTKHQFDADRIGFYAEVVAKRLPFRDSKGFILSPLGESKVDERTAIGIKVSLKDHPDVNLYFDKEKGYVLKSEFRNKDVMDNNKEVTDSYSFSEYQDLDGSLRPTRIVMKRDGKVYTQEEVTDYKELDKLDENLFAKP